MASEAYEVPTSNGFDTYWEHFVDDMNHPDNRGKPRGGMGRYGYFYGIKVTLTKWKTPLFEDEEIVELPVDQHCHHRRCTQKAIDFVGK